MKIAKRKIPDFILEFLHDFIGKKVAGIIIPPQSILQPQKNILITQEITITLYDATWGYLRLKPKVLETVGIKNMDLDNHQGILAFVERNLNPMNNSHERVYLPSYGMTIEYSEFIIKKIEVYGQNFQLNKEGKNIGKLLNRRNYVKGNLVIENDSVLILYSEIGNQIIVSVEMGNLLIGFDDVYKNQLISQPFLAYVSYENPVMLELNYIIE